MSQPTPRYMGLNTAHISRPIIDPMMIATTFATFATAFIMRY